MMQNANPTLDGTKSFVSHLEGAIDGVKLLHDEIQTLHENRPIWVRYDLEAVGASCSPTSFVGRESSMWRYRELLPPAPSDTLISLGEGMSPLLPCPKFAEKLGLSDVWIKDESQLPTGSFKSRGLAMAVTMAHKFGIKQVAIPTAGNAGGALAAYAARAGMEAIVFMPADTSRINQEECQLYDAKLFLVDGLINACGAMVKAGKERVGWFDMSTLKEPYRIEGKKTMGLELAEQFGWRLPDVILYPTGGGTGLIGMWKAFNELLELGWLTDSTLPRMVSVQSDGCCPIVRAFEAGERFAEPFADAKTIASGIRVPAAVGDFMILDAIRESHGTAVAVAESEIRNWQERGTRASGVALCPETAACVGALESLSASGWIKKQERVVIFNTGAAQKYLTADAPRPPIIKGPDDIDWKLFKH
jgi:threonine synthase